MVQDHTQVQQLINLAVDSSGNIIETTDGGGDITGSGTTNTVAKFTGAKAIGNGPITFATNNSTFAGTIVSDNIAVGLSDGNNSSISLTANTGNWTFTNVQASRNLEISDSDGTGTVMTIDTSGNIGIGTTSPSNKLEVFAPGNGDGILIQSGSAGVNRAPALHLNPIAASANERNWAIAPFRDVPQSLSFSSSNAKGGNAYLVATTRMIIDGISGNVGIGTASPAAKLSVVGSGENGGIFFGNSGAQEHRFYASANSQFNTIGSSSPIWNWAQYTGVGVTPNYKMTLNSTGLGIGTTSPLSKFDLRGTAYVTGYTVGFDTSPQGNYAYRLTNNGANSFINVLGGNLGIGTTSPSEILHLNESGGTGCFIRFQNTGGSGVYIGGRSETMEMYTNGSEKMRITSGGNVGIGVTNPNTKLQVAGIVQVVDGGNTAFYSGNYVRMFSTQSYGFRNSGGSNVALISVAGDSYFNGGNVGIGTTSPFSKLQVGNATFTGANGMHNDTRVGMSNHGALTGLMLASTYNDAAHPEYGLVFVQGPSTSSYNVWSISPDGPAKGSSLIFNYQAQSTNIHSPSNAKVCFQGSTGRVGIGTTSPNDIFDVRSPSWATRIQSTVDGTYLRMSANQIASYNSANAGSPLYINNSSSGNIIIAGGGGYVGIGTTSPDNKLTVKDANCIIDAQSTADGQTIGFRAGYLNNANLCGFFRYTTGDAQLYIDNNFNGNNGVYSDINIRNKTTGNVLTNRIKIKGSTGNVGIGDETPDYRLTVAKTSQAAPAFMVSGAYYGGPRIQTYGLDADPNAWMGLGTDMSGLPYEHSIYFSNKASTGQGALTIGSYDGTNYSTKMIVLNNGNVGIGNAAPQTTLHTGPPTTITNVFTARFAASNFFASGGNSMFYVPDTAANIMMFGSNQFGTNQIEFYHKNPGTSQAYVGRISTSGSATSYVTSSDYRLKENIIPLSDSISRINQLKPSRFNFIEEPGKVVDGFIAHEVQDIVPEAIVGEKDEVDEEGGIIPQGIDQAKLVPLLVAAVQELEARVKELENK